MTKSYLNRRSINRIKPVSACFHGENIIQATKICTSRNQAFMNQISSLLWLSAGKKLKGGDNRTLFLNNKLLFLLFFLLFLKILGGKRLWGGGAKVVLQGAPHL